MESAIRLWETHATLVVEIGVLNATPGIYRPRIPCFCQADDKCTWILTRERLHLPSLPLLETTRTVQHGQNAARSNGAPHCHHLAS